MLYILTFNPCKKIDFHGQMHLLHGLHVKNARERCTMKYIHNKSPFQVGIILMFLSSRMRTYFT